MCLCLLPYRIAVRIILTFFSWQVIKITTLSALHFQKASYITWRIVSNHKPRYCQEVERRQNSEQSSKRKWKLGKIIRFLHDITVTWVRNLYAGNVYFDPGMQKVETLAGTMQMVIWTSWAIAWVINNNLIWPMEPGQRGEDKLCDDSLLVPEKSVWPGYIFRHVNINIQFQ